VKYIFLIEINHQFFVNKKLIFKSLNTSTIKTMRVDLEVPFEEKDQAQEDGAKWDKDKRTWYMEKNVKKLEKYRRIYLFVPFEDKDQVKERGARWDKDKRMWYTAKFRSEDFEEWLADKREITFLEVPFDIRDDVKKAGGRWDANKKKWFFE